MKSCKYSSKQVCNYASMHVFNYSRIHVLTVSANLKVVHIGPKHVHIGHVLVQITPKMG